LEREARGDAHGSLLHDPDVDRACRVVLDGRAQVVEADVGHDHGDVLVATEHVDDRRHRLLAHRRHTTATTAVGPSEGRPSAARGAPWSRPSTVTASQPNAPSFSAISPSATLLERLSTAISVRLSSPAEPACSSASQFDPSFSSASPVSTKTRWS